MAKSSSFTDKERAAWHKERRRERQGDSDAGPSEGGGDTCINCGAPLSAEMPEGYEGALCSACE